MAAKNQTKPKAAPGRPSKYKPEFNKQAEKLCRLGATDRDIADFFQVSEATLNNWKLKHPEFLESLKRSKAEADALVEKSLFRRALGYSHPATKFFQAGGGILKQDYIEHYPPDTTACIFWLKNRKGEEWRANPEPGEDDNTAQPVKVEVTVRDARKPDADA